jgi:hypothetical protein
MKEHKRLRPDILLTFLAYFKGSVFQDEIFRLASLGIVAVNIKLDKEVVEGIPTKLQIFFPSGDGGWDSFAYRQGLDVLLRYNLLQRVEGNWTGVTMHSLVK